MLCRRSLVHSKPLRYNYGDTILRGLTMRVVFVENVIDVASAGDVKTVANGYARNYLLPRKLAIPATPQELKRLEERKNADGKREAKLGTRAGDLAGRIAEVNVVINARTGTSGRIYGAVTNARIAEELSRLVGQPIDRRKIRLDEPIRRLGDYQLEVHLTKDVTTNVKVTVLGEGQLASVMATEENTPTANARARTTKEAGEESARSAETPEEEPASGG
ncbi:MAG: 50S ribosomal protein L9 [Dehalococcoidia bacterium]|nr:50S ribosomal protein L9 [Dehalococcoidia bacterium]